jgi:broad specificity phosphatase PhoE
MVIYLLRHGEVAGAETRRLIGHLDVPLSARGERQCAAQAERLRAVSLAAVFTSDLSRACRSAEIIAAPHGLTPSVVPALREMDMGRWDGLTAAEVGERDPAAFAGWMARIGEFAFPGGESLGDLLGRAWPALEEIAAAFAGRSVAIVAHGGTNRALLCRMLGVSLGRILSFGQDYAALTIVERDGGRWCLRRLNERPEVAEEIS